MDGSGDTAHDTWHPFGRPLFDDPSSRALSRVGVLDVGSNSVRMVVFDGAARSPAYFFNEKIMCGLGEGLADTGKLNPEGRRRALEAIGRFQLLTKNMGVPPLTAVATAAVREASDGEDFCNEILEKTGLKLWVIDGEEEARLSAQGVLLGWPGSYGLVCDIGGSSMELAEINDGKVGRRVSSSLGPQKLMHLKGGKRGRKREIQSQLETLAETMGPQRNRLFLVGGSWRAFARIDMERRGYQLHVLHEYRMTPKSIRATAKYIANSDLEELRAACGISSARMALVPIASEVLVRLIRRFKIRDIAISSYGIREGMLYQQMPERLRERDPLIEACRFAESKDARVPGFGKLLYEFVLPLFRQRQTPHRLIKAACLLHDVSWRGHPDYRAEMCFDSATRANLGGLSHSERVFLGLALMYRYRNRMDNSPFLPLMDLADDAQKRDAEVLGKAMRFGAMLTMEGNTSIGKLLWAPKKKVLTLQLPQEHWPLYGEVAQARLKSLADTLGGSVVAKPEKPARTGKPAGTL